MTIEAKPPSDEAAPQPSNTDTIGSVGGTGNFESDKPAEVEVDEVTGVISEENQPLLGDTLTANNLSNLTPPQLQKLLGEMTALTKAISSLPGAEPSKNDPQPKLVEPPLDNEESDEKQETAPEPEAEKALVKGEEEVEMHSPFRESCYTMVYMYSAKEPIFWYGLFVIGLQMMTISLTLINILDRSSSGADVLQMPPMVDLTVTIAQAVAVYLAVAFQQDLIEAVLKLHDGFYPELLEERPAATYASWLLSCLAQLASGCLLLLTIFILTMQATDVIGIMLNFAALHFMAEIDDLGFTIAKWGFITNTMQKKAEAVEGFEVPKRNKGYLTRRVVYTVILCSLFAGYAVAKRNQLQGIHLQTHLRVQLGDAYDPTLSYYSGLYSTSEQRTAGRREYREVRTNTILLSYCQSESSWTFSRIVNGEEDPCNFFARSESTDTYDVTTLGDYQWLIQDPLTSRFVPFESFSLIGADCNEDTCQGQCVEGLCQCPPDRFGTDCEFGHVCPELAVRAKSPPFAPDALGYAVASEFSLFHDPETGKPVRVYAMPVYYSNSTFPANFIFFSGRRWVLTSEFGVAVSWANFSQEVLDTVNFPGMTADYLKNPDFHGHVNASHAPIYLSDPMDFETPEFQASPIGLGWYNAVPLDSNNVTAFRTGSAIETVLLCQSCKSEYGGFCSKGGTCNETSGTCDCWPDFSGDRCDIQKNCYDQIDPCKGGGVCDLTTGICRCSDPYYGKLCEWTYYCFEEDGKCFNGGVCNPSSTNYDSLYCECTDPATSGEACQRRKDCTIWGCNNGGVCDEDSGVCDCPAPFYGFGCDLVNKTKQDLLCVEDKDCADGTCDTETGLCACVDPISYGSLCELKYNCTESGCMNGGNCNSTTTICECEAPFMGMDCSEVPDCTVDTDCMGGGECNVTLGSCTCENSFASGKLCEKDNNCKAVGGCNGRGVCNRHGYCQCSQPFTGSLCNYILDDDAY